MPLATTENPAQLVKPVDPTLLEHVISCYAQNMGFHILLESIGDGMQFTRESAYSLLDGQFAGINTQLGLERTPNFDPEDFKIIWKKLLPITQDGVTIPFLGVDKPKFRLYAHYAFTAAKLLYRLLTVGTCDYRPDSRIQAYDRIWSLLSECTLKGLPTKDDDEE